MGADAAGESACATIWNAVLATYREVRPASAIDPDAPPVSTPRIVSPALRLAALPEQTDPAACICIAIIPPHIVRGARDHGSVVASAVEIPIPIPIPIVPAVEIAVIAATIVASAPIISALPDQVESITFAATLRVFNAHHRYAATLARVAHQLNASAAIDSLETELGRTRRERARTLEPAKLSGLSRQSPYPSEISADFHFSGLVHVDFNRTFPAIASPAPHNGSHGGPRLSSQR
jgi:hypothetical protein